MAKLRNINESLLLDLILYPDPDSYDWIIYEMIIRSTGKNSKPLLHLDNLGKILYFEACNIQEILIFCDGIMDVIKGKKKSFFFEPLDERDFQFNIKKAKKENFQLDTKATKDEIFLVDIYSEDFMVLENYDWDRRSYLGIKMYVAKKDLLDFIEQLKKEYKKIISKYPKDPDCSR